MLRLTTTALLVSLAALGCDAPAPADAGVDGGPTTDGGSSGCAASGEGPATAVFVAPGAETPFFDLPWPSDARRTASGTIDVTGFPNPRVNPTIRLYLNEISETLDGYATNGSIYFRFSHELDVSSLPASPAASLEAGSTVVLIDIDPGSSERGQRVPIATHYQACATRFWAASTLAIRPVYGWPLASARRYAAVVLSGVRSTDGADFARDEDFSALLDGGGGPEVAAVRDAFGDLSGALTEAGLDPADVISATVFTTQDAIGETIAIRDWMHANYPAPQVVADSVRTLSNLPRFSEVEGHYGPVPIFQEGVVPYESEGGAIRLDDAGEPTVHGEYDARFALVVPTSEMPEDGYPILLYAHGTGGDYRTLSRNGFAEGLARLGIASMGVDQIHHGERNPTSGDPSILFFNIPNPQAARDNNRQSALDVVQQARLVADLSFPSLDRGGQPAHFDESQVLFMGHSQGGLNGPLFLAIDDAAQGGVLSAASAVLPPSLIEKVEPVSIPAIVVSLLGLTGNDTADALAREGFTVEHPVPTLLQMWVEASDASNYAHLIFQSPREGFEPKSVLMTEGLMDRFSPPTSIEALAGAMRVPVVQPGHAMIEANVLRGLTPVATPVRANAPGGATVGLLQFPEHGHFAVFDSEDAEAQVYAFLGSMLEGTPTITAAP